MKFRAQRSKLCQMCAGCSVFTAATSKHPQGKSEQLEGEGLKMLSVCSSETHCWVKQGCGNISEALHCLSQG